MPNLCPFAQLACRGAAPLPLAGPEGFASLSDGSGGSVGSGSSLRGGPMVPASPLIRPGREGEGGGPPLPLRLSPARQPSMERPPSAGTVLPLFGRRTSSVLTPGKYAGGGLPPLPPSPREE